MNKKYKNETETISEALYIMEDFMLSIEKLKEKYNIEYKCRLNKVDDKWVLKMFVDEKEIMDQIFGRDDKPPTIL